MTKIGYGRVSTDDQHPEAQHDALTADGCEKIFIDAGVSGKLASRPQWDLCRAYLRSGDTLVVAKLDRLGRSLRNLIEILEWLGEVGAHLRVLDQGFDTSTPAGELFFHLVGAFAQYEHSMILARTRDGMNAARARGRNGGAKPKLRARQIEKVREMYDARGDDGMRLHTVQEIANLFNVARPTIYAALERKLTEKQITAARQMHSARDGSRSIEQIADRFGVTRDAVREALGLELAAV